MPVWYGVGTPKLSKSFINRLQKKNKKDRLIAETQFTQLIAVRVFRAVYKRLTPSQRIRFQSVMHLNDARERIVKLFEESIPEISSIIHQSVQSVYRDLET